MRCTLVDRADFEYVADLSPVPNPPGLYSLTITTRWRGAKQPEAEQVKLDVLVDREGLLRLRELIDLACGSSPRRTRNRRQLPAGH